MINTELSNKLSGIILNVEKKFSDAITYPYRLYKNNRYVNMNVNVLAAASPSITIASFASKYFKNSAISNLENSVLTATIDWAVYIPVHIGLQYFSNKDKFRKEDGTIDAKAFAKDVLKIYTTYIPSIILFYAVAGPAHNLCLKLGMDGNTATQISYWGTMTITRALHTYNLLKADKRNTKIFRSD